MFSIIGIVVVFGAVVAGYLMEHGNLKVLMQPAELIIILGAAIGTVLIANPIHILMKIVSGMGAAFGGSPFNKQRYTDDAIEKHGVVGTAIRVLQKPFNHETLLRSVREALGPEAQASAFGESSRLARP
jgi:flagellar motor component MotA